jgi:hypothetical protein
MRWLLPLLLLPAAAVAQPMVTIDTANCQLLMRHVMAPDVSYKPGVDVQGRAVAPADLPSNNTLELPKSIPIDIEIPVRTILGPNSPYLTGDAKIQVGRVVVEADGRVLFNGKPIPDTGRDQLIAACRLR